MTNNGKKRIYLSVPHIGEKEEAYVREAFAANWISTVGENLKRFEEQFSTMAGLPSVALSSGTAAIHMALRVLGVGPGDEVICPTFTFAAACNPILYEGASAVFFGQ